MAKITGRDKRVADWLEKIGIDPKITRRVVIDIPSDGIVWVYIERYGDSQIFEVEPPPELTTAIHLVPPQEDFEEAIKIIKGLKASEQPIIPCPIDPPPHEPTPDEAEKAIEYTALLPKGYRQEGLPIKKIEKEQEPTPEWLAEFEAKQQAAISKWEHPDD